MTNELVGIMTYLHGTSGTTISEIRDSSPVIMSVLHDDKIAGLDSCGESLEVAFTGITPRGGAADGLVVDG